MPHPMSPHLRQRICQQCFETLRGFETHTHGSAEAQSSCSTTVPQWRCWLDVQDMQSIDTGMVLHARTPVRGSLWRTNALRTHSM